MNTETLTWMRPELGQFPDADLDVLVHTDDDESPMQIAAYQGDDCWSDPKGRQLRCRVIEWSRPHGAVPARSPFAELERVALRGRVERAPRPEAAQPDGVAKTAIGLLEKRGWRCIPPAVAGLECACASTPAGADFCPLHSPAAPEEEAHEH
jgi:hypothetical protein